MGADLAIPQFSPCSDRPPTWIFECFKFVTQTKYPANLTNSLDFSLYSLKGKAATVQLMQNTAHTRDYDHMKSLTDIEKCQADGKRIPVECLILNAWQDFRQLFINALRTCCWFAGYKPLVSHHTLKFDFSLESEDVYLRENPRCLKDEECFLRSNQIKYQLANQIELDEHERYFKLLSDGKEDNSSYNLSLLQTHPLWVLVNTLWRRSRRPCPSQISSLSRYILLRIHLFFIAVIFSALVDNLYWLLTQAVRIPTVKVTISPQNTENYSLTLTVKSWGTLDGSKNTKFGLSRRVAYPCACILALGFLTTGISALNT